MTGNLLQRQARALGDPTRYALFQWIEGQDEPVGVAELDARFSLNHTTVRQHLARLVEAELLVEETAPPAGPGRPRLVYRVAAGVEGTWRQDGPYQRLALLLLQLIETGSPARAVGAAEGRRLAARERAQVDPVATMEHCMAEQGFAPRRDERARGFDIVMTHCPFAEAATAAPAVVCELHRGIADGLAEGLGGVNVVDLLARTPARAGCRLRLTAQPTPQPRRAATPTAKRGKQARSSSGG